MEGASKGKWSRMWKRIIVLLAIVCTVIITPLLLRGCGKEYLPILTISSPDKSYELVVCEWGTLGGTGSEIYIRNSKNNQWWNGWIRTKIGQTIADDSVYPFFEGNYKVTWEDGKVFICYYSGNQSENIDDPTTWRNQIVYEIN